MLKKRLLSCMIFIGILTSGIAVRADEPCDYEYFINSAVTLSDNLGTSEKVFEIPEECNVYSEAYIKALMKGIVKTEELEMLSGIVNKQDAMNILYRILINADSVYSVTEEEADEILNECYDNAYLKPENRVAYAAMIKYGIISVDSLTQPDKVLTKENLKLLENSINALFLRQMPVKIGDKEISAGTPVCEIIDRFGEPDRIDENEFGFSWYVYNSHYSDFVMIGIKNSAVCAYFTNSKNFEFDGITKNSDLPYSADTDCLYIFRNADGLAKGVYYNPFSDEIRADYNDKNQEMELIDIINAERVSDNLLTYTKLNPEITQVVSILNNANTPESVYVNSVDCITAYENMLVSDEGKKILSFGEIEPHTLNIGIVRGEKGTLWDMSLSVASGMMFSNHDNSEIIFTEILESVKTPVLKELTEDNIDVYGNLVLELEERCSDKYLVKIYNHETEMYDVNAYIECKYSKIVIPARVLTRGNMYSVCVNAVDGEDELVGNTQEFMFGSVDRPVALLSPGNGLSTYDDQLEISVASDAYNEFRIEVYDKNNRVVKSAQLIDRGDCILESLPAGTYTVKATAVSHATGEDMGSETSVVTIKKCVPVVKEFIIEADEEYNYYYGDGSEWIYFYETQPFTEKAERKVRVPVETSGANAQGEAVTKEVTEIYEVKKIKIIQKKYPSTKKYRALADMSSNELSTGDIIKSFSKMAGSSEIGNSIAALALSYRGVPYVWGGETPSGFDCSGLVKYVCNSLGIYSIERHSAHQFARNGVFVEREKLIPGDFLYFQKNGKIHHVGIYIGNNMMVHAPHTGDVVRIANLSDPYWQKEYAGAKRVF